LYASSVLKFSITLLTVVVPSRLRILGIQYATAHRLSLASILVPRYYWHPCIQVFSHYVADHLSLANNSLLQMLRFWQTSSIKILAFFAFVSFTVIAIALRAYPVKPCLSDILAIAIRLVQPSIYLRVVAYAQDVVTPPLSYGSSAAVVKSTLSPRHRSLSSYPLAS
jgi:hypothetical protein